jgi:hypothetical protein
MNGIKKDGKLRYIAIELAHHLPYSIFGVVSAIIVMGLVSVMAGLGHDGHGHDHDSAARAFMDLFHVFHPAHVLISAVATTAMFWKHDNHNIMKAVLVGFIGSVAICGVSDIIVPFAGGLILGHEMHFHLCIVEEPGLVFPFAAVGVLSGLAVTRSFDRSTEYSHGVHVFLSGMASLLFLIGFGFTDWMHATGEVFLVTIIAVMFPCCLSDIVFPLACTHRYCDHPENPPAHG